MPTAPPVSRFNLKTPRIVVVSIVDISYIDLDPKYVPVKVAALPVPPVTLIVPKVVGYVPTGDSVKVIGLDETYNPGSPTATSVITPGPPGVPLSISVTTSKVGFPPNSTNPPVAVKRSSTL